MFQALCLMFLLLFFTPGAGAQSLSVKPPREFTPYTGNIIRVDAPEAGRFSLRVKSGAVDWLIADNVPLAAGAHELEYDGLHANGEPLHPGQFVLEGSLAAEGKDYTWQGEVQARRPAATLQYVLARNDLLYLRGGSLEVDLFRTGPLKFSVTVRGENEQAESGRPVRFLQDKTHSLLFSWDGLVDGSPLAPGNHILRFTAEKGMVPYVDIPFTAVDEAPPEHRLAVTPAGHFLPENLDDQAVWQAMMAPLTVVRGRDLVRQNVYERPDTASRVVGRVFSGTAGLKVLALEGDFARVGAWRDADGSYMEGYIPGGRLTTLWPNRHWGLLLNKKEQTMTVYHDGAVVGKARVSTGLMSPEKPRQETRAGAFALGQRLPYLDNRGFRYRYAIRMDGFNLIHQMGYPIGGRMSFEYEDALMGSKASHGCVRIDRLPGEGGVNAFWMWTRLPGNTKMLVLDDREERHARMAELGLAPSD